MAICMNDNAIIFMSWEGGVSETESMQQNGTDLPWKYAKIMQKWMDGNVWR